MSAKDEMNNSKDNFIKMKAPLYFSPYSNKKHSLGNLYTEPRNIHQEIDSKLSKNQIKQKINNANLTRNMINIQQPDTLRKNTRLLSEITDKVNQNKKNPQSYKKVNSKLYLKKNVIQNISSLNETNEGNILSTQPNTNSNTNINNINNDQKQFLKNRLSNIRFNIGKSSQNFLNSKNSTSNLKKNAGSACELLDNNNYLKKSKTKNKNFVDINNINPIGYIYTTGNNQKSFFSPQNHGSNPKIIFLKNEKSKYQNSSKDSKINQTQGNEQNNNNEGDNKKNQINCLLRNTFTNVKIYPTTILNNKIIYNQIEKNNQNKNNNSNKDNKNNKSESSNNNSSMHYNNSKIKKEKIVIETVDKRSNVNNNEDFQSIEELHYFYVNTLQRGKNIANKLDK